MKDDTLVKTLKAAVEELEREVVDLVDLDIDDRGRSKPVIAVRDREYFSAISETAQAIRDLIAMVEARQEETR